jgi:hypothetical protein
MSKHFNSDYYLGPQPNISDEVLSEVIEYLVEEAAEMGRAATFDLLEKIEGKKTTYNEVCKRAASNRAARKKKRDNETGITKD